MKTQTVQNTQILEDYLEVGVDSFLKDRKAQNLTKGTVQFYRYNLNVFIEYCKSQEVKLVSQITPQFLRDFLLLLEERGHNSGGTHVFYRVVKSFLRWYWEEIEPAYPNPINKVKAPKVPLEPIQGITREEFDSLLEICKKNTFIGERNRAILMVLYDTGVRASELCDIKLDDLSLGDSSILIRQGKGRKPRLVFFGKSTRKQLRRYLRYINSPYLFTNRNGDKLIFTALREIIRRLATKAEIKGISPHDFRRAFCLECLRKGIPEITIARLMGHTTTQLIGRYAKQTTADLGTSYKSVIDD
jgi:integrase/recombinase XerD